MRTDDSTLLCAFFALQFYPDYWGKTKPEPQGLPTTLSYGGDYFNVTLPASAFAQTSDVNTTTFVVERTGFSTHAMNMGMRHVQLDSTFTVADDGSATFHVAQLYPNPAILAPGPALLFAVVGGVPSNATWIMCGSGKVENQTLSDPSTLPSSSVPRSYWADGSSDSSTSTSAAGGASETGSSGSGGTSSGVKRSTIAGWSSVGVLALGLLAAL